MTHSRGVDCSRDETNLHRCCPHSGDLRQVGKQTSSRWDTFYFPAQLAGGFTLSDLLDKPWSQVSSLLPPVTCLQFLLRTRYTVQHSHCSSIFIECCQLTLSRFPPINFYFYPRKSPYEYVHSVRIELAKLILVGTRITYEATGDAGYLSFIYFKHTKLWSMDLASFSWVDSGVFPAKCASRWGPEPPPRFGKSAHIIRNYASSTYMWTSHVTPHAEKSSTKTWLDTGLQRVAPNGTSK